MRHRLKPRYAWFVPWFYWGGTGLLRFLLTILVRWKVVGRSRVPQSGPLIVVANHLSNADPAIVGAGIARRRIRWMAKVELFAYPFGLLPRLWGAFPVRRFEADMGAMLNAERLLRRGEVLGMFPEGTRSRTGLMGRPQPGTALIALRAGATVLPCAVTGTEHFSKPWKLLWRPRITVVIGEAIRLEAVRRPTEEQVTALTNRIYTEIQALLPRPQPASYTGSEKAGVPDGPDSPRE